MTGSRPVALVTGAARGLGAAVAARLVARGHLVVALDSCAGEAGAATPGHPLATRADLDALADRHGPAVEPVVADVRDLPRLREVVDGAVDRHGRLDVVVGGAAVLAGGKPLWETDPGQLDLLLDVDARGLWNTAAATVPHLLSRPADDRPTFVGVTSAAGDTGLFGLSAYVVAKHAAVGVVRALAADLVGTGVTACGVAPGAMATDMLQATASAYGLDGVGPLVEGMAQRRPLDPDEVAAVVEIACTAGTAVHGTILDARGGMAG